MMLVPKIESMVFASTVIAAVAPLMRPIIAGASQLAMAFATPCTVACSAAQDAENCMFSRNAFPSALLTARTALRMTPNTNTRLSMVFMRAENESIAAFARSMPADTEAPALL